MSAACKGGAALGNASRKQEDALAAFGLKFGYAFQIADDILDYTAEERAFGKSLGKDLEEGKITLPLIYLLRDAEDSESARVKEIISAETKTESALSYVQGLFEKHKSIEKSSKRAYAFLNEAKAELDIFEDSMEKTSLLAIADYAVTRRK